MEHSRASVLECLHLCGEVAIVGHFIIPEALENGGVILCQPDHTTPDDATVVIEGVARGGTSMIAALVNSAGYQMEAEAPSYECLRWKHAIKYGGDLRKIVTERDEMYTRWAVKHPGLMDYWISSWESFLLSLRNPRVVIVMRDPVAIDTRAWLADRRHTAELAVKQMGALINWSIGTEFPVALVSYEKMLSATDEAKSVFERFVGGECDWDRVEPNNKLYISQIGARHEA